MELISAHGGVVPDGRKPVGGGHEVSNGLLEPLYHAVAIVKGMRVPGKAGKHLVSRSLAFNHVDRRMM